MTVKPSRQRVGLLALVLVALTACQGGSQAPASGATGKITIALGSEPTTLDAQVRDDGNMRAVTDNIYEALMNRMPDGTLVPGLAASPPTLVNPTTWQFKLRKGISFTNGEPFNADSVVASVKRILDPAFKSEQLSFYGSITSATKVDDSTVNIVSKAPNVVVPASMYWMRMVPTKYSSDPNFASKPIGTGPYKFVEWVRGDHITITANAAYWGDKPSIGQVTYKFIEEAGTRLAGLLNNEFDLIENLTPEDAPKVPKAVSNDGTQNSLIILNSVSGVTKDLRVRQALQYAIDNQAIAKNLYGGFASVENCQFMNPNWFGFNTQLQNLPYDPAKAKSLLADAGAAGATIDFTSTSGRWLKDGELSQSVADYWRAVGLKVNLKTLEFNAYLNQLFDTKNRPQAIFLMHDNNLLDASRTLDALYSQQGIMVSNNNTEITPLINAGDIETDPQKRLQDYQQALKIGCDQSLFTFMVRPKDIFGISKRLSWAARSDGAILIKEMKLTG